MDKPEHERALFITIEGGEGAGKTTLIAALQAYMESRDMPVLVTREPGGIAIAEQIRGILLDPAHTEMDARTEALLYAAARRQHMAEKVVPALAAGQSVICDRFIDSSLAYQGHARGLGMEAVLAVNEFAIEGRMPDLTLLLDVDPGTGLFRRRAEGGQNRLDLEELEFHNRVREGYSLLLDRFPNRMVRIDASASPQLVREAALSILADRLVV